MKTSFPAFLAGSLHRLKRCPTYLLRSAGVEALAAPRASAASMLPGPQALLILSRRLTRFASLELPPMARRRRLAALRLQLGQLTPYERTGAFALLGAARAALWYWDRTAVDNTAQSLEVDSPWVVPEALMTAPGADGLRLVACAEGVEAQQWRDGLPVGCQWWPRPPGETEWTAFLRQLGPQAAGEAMPPLQRLPWLRTPWAVNALPAEQAVGAASVERLAYGAGALALAIWASWLAGAWIKVEVTSRRNAEALAAVSQTREPAVRARREAIEDARYVEQLYAALKPDPRGVLVALAQALPVEGLALADFDLRDGMVRARLTSKAANPPITELVERLNASAAITDAKVNTESGGRAVIVTAQTRARAGGS
jgi:hypothetical protein